VKSCAIQFITARTCLGTVRPCACTSETGSVPHQSALPVGHDRYVALAAPALGSAEAHQPFADVVALRPHRGAQLGARGDAERGARRVVGLELGQELV